MTTITPPTVERLSSTNAVPQWWPSPSVWPAKGPIRVALQRATDAHRDHAEVAAERRRLLSEVDRAERADDRARGIASAEGTEAPERQAPRLRARLLELERVVPEKRVASDHCRSLAMQVLAEHGPSWRAEVAESRVAALAEYASAADAVRAARGAVAELDGLLRWHDQLAAGRLRGAHARGEPRFFEALVADVTELSQPDPPTSVLVQGDDS